MKGIAEVEMVVNKELQFGKLIHSPVVAWAFDMSCASVGPEPVAVGGYAPFLKIDNTTDYRLAPANPGFFQMSYLAALRPEHFKKLTAEQQADIKKNAGCFYLGVWMPEDTTDWRKAALQCEEEIFEDIIMQATGTENPMDEFCGALQGDGNAACAG